MFSVGFLKPMLGVELGAAERCEAEPEGSGVIRQRGVLAGVVYRLMKKTILLIIGSDIAPIHQADGVPVQQLQMDAF